MDFINFIKFDDIFIVHKYLEEKNNNNVKEYNKEFNRRNIQVIQIDFNKLDSTVLLNTQDIPIDQNWIKRNLFFKEDKKIFLICRNFKLNSPFKIAFLDFSSLEIGFLFYNCSFGHIRFFNSKKIEFISFVECDLRRVHIDKVQLKKVLFDRSTFQSDGAININYSKIVGESTSKEISYYDKDFISTENNGALCLTGFNRIENINIQDSEINSIQLFSNDEKVVLKQLLFKGIKVDKFLLVKDLQVEKIELIESKFGFINILNVSFSKYFRDNSERDDFFLKKITVVNCIFKNFEFDNISHDLKIEECLFEKPLRILFFDKNIIKNINNVTFQKTIIKADFEFDINILIVEECELYNFNIRNNDSLTQIKILRSSIKNIFFIENTHSIKEFTLKESIIEEVGNISLQKKMNFFYEENHINKVLNMNNVCFLEQSYFSKSSLSKIVFNKCDFSCVNLIKFDMDSSEFKDCIWLMTDIYSFKIKKYWLDLNSSSALYISEYFLFKKTEQVLDQEFQNMNINDVILYKEKFSLLRKKYEENKDFIVSESFRYSESNARQSIYFHRKDYFNYFLMKIHELLSGYGTSYVTPLFWMILGILFFSCIYLCTGIKIDNNESSSLLKNEMLSSVIFSMKNIIPFKIKDFYIQPKNGITQIVVLIHKVLNVVLLGSFIMAFRRFLFNKQ